MAIKYFYSKTNEIKEVKCSVFTHDFLTWKGATDYYKDKFSRTGLPAVVNIENGGKFTDGVELKFSVPKEKVNLLCAAYPEIMQINVLDPYIMKDQKGNNTVFHVAKLTDGSYYLVGEAYSDRTNHYFVSPSGREMTIDAQGKPFDYRGKTNENMITWSKFCYINLENIIEHFKLIPIANLPSFTQRMQLVNPSISNQPTATAQPSIQTQAIAGQSQSTTSHFTLPQMADNQASPTPVIIQPANNIQANSPQIDAANFSSSPGADFNQDEIAEAIRLSLLTIQPTPAATPHVEPVAQPVTNPTVPSAAASNLGLFAPTRDNEVKKDSLEEQLVCPITQEIMKDPVVFSVDGITYERNAITKWLSSHNSSPITRQSIEAHKTIDQCLTPNRLVKAIIESSGFLKQERNEPAPSLR